MSRSEPDFWNPQIETMDDGSRKAMQEVLLEEQIARVARDSDFYARTFESLDLDIGAGDFGRNFERLPFTTKEELRESQNAAPPLGDHSAVGMDEVIRIHSSTGTTGRPSYIGLTRRDRDVWTEVVSRVYFCEGLRPSDTIVHGFGLGFFVGGLPVQDASEEIGAAFVPVGSGSADKILTSIRNLDASVLTCTPSYAQYIAEYVRERHGIEPSELGLRRLMLGAEPGGGVPAVRRKIGEDYGSVVTEGLGNADLIAVYAGSCEAGDGMHFLAPDHLYLELIEPLTEEVLDWEDGAEGELVATHLTRECCPLIRFRTRDRIRVSASPCACGRTGPRLTCVGRTDDMLIVRGINVWPSAVSDVIGGMRPVTTGAVQILLEKPGPKVDPPLQLQVEFGPEATDLDRLKDEIENVLHERLFVRCEVELLPPGTLPRFEMKARPIRKLYDEPLLGRRHIL